MIDRKISHFQVMRKLGEGGMGVVWEATDLELERTVALKVLRREFLEKEDRRARFFREARAAAKVTHPNLATIYEVGEDNGEIFLAMELIAGRTLRDEIGGKPLPVSRTVQLAAPMAEGLAAAHAASVIHRDLKPENVMVDDAGRPRILDFGLAKLLDTPLEGSDSSELETVTGETREGRILGTVAYMSPEQARGLRVDSRSDVFSFGITLYEMITGKAPFLGETNSDTLARILRDDPQPVPELNPEVPAELVRILTKCLAKDPAERYQDTRDLALDLRQLARQSDSGSLPPGVASGSAGVAPYASSASGSAAPYSGSGSGSASASGPATPYPASGSGEAVAARPRRPSVLLLGALVIVALAAIVISDRWRVPSRPDTPTPAVALQNSLAVMPFRNLKDDTDSERLGQILQELIITDLSGMGSLKLFSSQRLFDLQKQVGGSDRQAFDRDTASRIARKAGAQTMLEGTLSRLGDQWIVTTQLVDVESGTVAGSQRIDGTDLYTMVDELTNRLREEPRLALGGTDDTGPLKERTSNSLEAYRLYLVGVDLLEQGEYAPAADTLALAVAADPAFGQAYYKQAMALWWLNGDMADSHGTPTAQAPLTHLLSGATHASRKDRMMAEAAYAMFGNDWEAAISLYEQVTHEFPDEKEGWYGLGESRFHSGLAGRTESLGAFEKAIDLAPDFALAYSHVGDLYVQNGQFDLALKRAKDYVGAHPEDEVGYERWLQAATVLDHDPEIESALQAVRDRFHEGQEIQKILVVAADECRSRMDLTRAEGFLEEARELDPEGVDLDWYQARGQIYREAGEFDALDDLVQQIHQQMPEHSRELAPARIEILTLKGDYEGAMELADSSAAEWDDYDIEAGDRLARLRATLDDVVFLEALDDGLSDATSTTDSLRIFERLGQTDMDLHHDAKSAMAWFERAAAIDPERNASGWMQGLAWSRLVLGDLSGARAAFEEYAEHRPAHSNHKVGRAYVALLQGDLALADSLSLKLVQTGTRTSQGYLCRSYVLAGQERWEEAEAAARKSLGMDGLRRSHVQLAWVLIESGRDPEEGVELARRALGDDRHVRMEIRDLFPFVPSAEHCLGLAALRAGRNEEAVSHLEAAAEQRPDRPRILQDLELARQSL